MRGFAIDGTRMKYKVTAAKNWRRLRREIYTYLHAQDMAALEQSKPELVAKVAEILHTPNDGTHRLARSLHAVDSRRLAEKIAAKLFTCGGKKADLLHLMREGKYLAGWAEKPAADAIESEIKSAIQAQDPPPGKRALSGKETMKKHNDSSAERGGSLERMVSQRTYCLACADGKWLSPGWKCSVCGRHGSSPAHGSCKQ